jgi:hypothetical protein
LPEQGIISATTNQSLGAVEFDWFVIKDAIWKLREKNIYPQSAYMLHTHPMGFNLMSSIDKNMVYGWVAALWMPIFFSVITNDIVTTYLCYPTQNKKIEINLIGIKPYEKLLIELHVIARTMYGISKAPHITDEEMQGIINQIKESNLSWVSLHEWN